ncbi:hypothetical protein Xmar_07225 [Xanthomonas axonopodis pv. martyniicola]|nr:hypothetical protein Xmar_07225 [Xanthomonas axonopodis pv. martyniicola]OOW93235.1 hypothetical protein Xvtr_14955 [Xanthomonas campestris pv. vitiscarnosae]
MADQAAFAQALHSQQQVVVDVVLAGAMWLADVEIVQAKIAQRCLATGPDRCNREVTLLRTTDTGLAGQRTALAGHDKRIPRTLRQQGAQDPSQARLRMEGGVVVAGIEQVHALRQRVLDHACGGAFVEAPMAPRAGTSLTDRRDQ